MFLAFVLASVPALAHVGAPVDAVDIHPVGEAGRALEASVGLGWTEDGLDWRWVCHEAITTPDAVITPAYAFSGRRWLATVPRLEQSRTGADAVYWTDDGCTWSSALGLSGREVPAVDLELAGTIALAVTGDAEGANSIYRSNDGGVSFEAALTLDDHIFNSVVIARGSAGTAVAGSVDASGRGYLHWSGDQGVSWTSTGVFDGEVVAMALHPTDPSVGYAVVDGTGVETLLRTGDGGRTVEVLIDPETYIADVEVGADGQVWVAFGGTAFLHAADGVTFELVTEAPPGLGVSLVDDQVLLATRYEFVNSALSEGSLSSGFEPVFTFESFDGALECPAGTRGADVCTPLFPRLQESLGLGDFPDTGGSSGSGAGSDRGDSGSAVGGPAVGASKDSGGCGSRAWLLLLPAVFFGGFRRRPAGD